MSTRKATGRRRPTLSPADRTEQAGPPVRIAVIADIHGNALALEAVLADIAARDVDVLCNLGDHFSGPLEPGRTFSILAGMDMVAIRGNHDRYLLEKPLERMEAGDALAHDEIGAAGRDWLERLPRTARAGTVLFLCHGTPDSDKTHWLYEKDEAKRLHPVVPLAIAEEAEGVDLPLICCGHTHVQRQVMLPDGRGVFNPGSVGRPAFAMRDPDSAARRSPAAQYGLLEADGAGWAIALRQVDYDHEGAARIAEARGELQWAENLRRGWER